MPSQPDVDTTMAPPFGEKPRTVPLAATSRAPRVPLTRARNPTAAEDRCEDEPFHAGLDGCVDQVVVALIVDGLERVLPAPSGGIGGGDDGLDALTGRMQ